MKKLLAAMLAVVLVAGSAGAYDLPAVNLGATSFLDGGPPAGPGVYFTEYLQWYHANRFDRPPKPIDRLEVYASLSQVIYQSNQKVLLGGKWGLNLIVPVVKIERDSSSPLPANDLGLGDLNVGPFIQWDPIMGDKGPVFMHRVEFTLLAPTGRYSNKYALNPGANAFSINPYWAATWFPTPKCTLSWRLHYLWNDENDDPFVGTKLSRVQAGQAVHLNFASSYELLEKRLRVGINGYYLKQVTDSQYNGVSVTGTQEQVVGIGPGAVWHISQNDHIFANIYFEFAADNRPEGQRYNLRWVHHF